MKKPLSPFFLLQWFALMCFVAFFPVVALIVGLVLWLVRYAAREFGKASRPGPPP